MNGCTLGAPIVPVERVRAWLETAGPFEVTEEQARVLVAVYEQRYGRAHVWQAYPLDDVDNLFQCSGCHVLVADAITAQRIPGTCPGDAPRLPHILRTRDGVLSCVGCPVPPVDSWEWTCGGGPHARLCEGCHAHRLTTTYRWFQLASLCAACAATKRTLRNP